MPGGDFQQRLAHRRGHPAVDAVADDVVERAGILGQVGNALTADFDIGQAEPGNAVLCVCDLTAAEIDAEKLRLRVQRRQGDDVAASRAAQLQHAGPGHRRGFVAEQAGNSRQPQRMGAGKRLGVVGKLVIALRDQREAGGKFVGSLPIASHRTPPWLAMAQLRGMDKRITKSLRWLSGCLLRGGGGGDCHCRRDRHPAHGQDANRPLDHLPFEHALACRRRKRHVIDSAHHVHAC